MPITFVMDLGLGNAIEAVCRGVPRAIEPRSRLAEETPGINRC